MSISVDTTSNQTYTSSNSTSWSHTVGTSKSGRVLVITFMAIENDIVPSATYGGKSMTSVSSKSDGTNNLYCEIFILINPPTGSNTVSITWTGLATSGGAGAVSLYGARYILEGSATSEGPTASNPSLTVTSRTGGISIDCVSSTSTATYTIGSGQVAMINNSTARCHSSYELATSSSTSMTWTKGTGSTHIGAAVSLIPGTLGVGATASPFMRFQ